MKLQLLEVQLQHAENQKMLASLKAVLYKLPGSIAMKVGVVNSLDIVQQSSEMVNAELDKFHRSLYG